MAKNGHFNENWTTVDGLPQGGVSCGRGFTICWQNGPLGRGNDRKEPNGAFIEDILDAAKRRLEYHQTTKFKCADNTLALNHLKAALAALDRRTRIREKRGVEGTHEA